MASKKLRDQATTRGASKATMGVDVTPRLPPPESMHGAADVFPGSDYPDAVPPGQDPTKSFVEPQPDERAVLKSSLPSPLAVETALQETSEVVVSPAPPVDTISRAAEAPQEPRTVVHVWRCTQHPTHRISSTTVRDVEQRCPVCSSPMSYAVEPA